MSTQPWMKFYPSDWRADPSLRICSLSARGLWIEMLCLMHEADPRGSLLVNGKAVGAKQLAPLVGSSVREIEALLSELEEAGVFSREDSGVIYSRRIRRDIEKADRDKANGKGGGNPNLKRGVNPQDKGGDKAQKPEARSQRPESSSSGSNDPAAAAIAAASADADFDRQCRQAAAGEPCADSGSLKPIYDWLAKGCPKSVILTAIEAAIRKASASSAGFKSFASFDGWIEREWGAAKSSQAKPGRVLTADELTAARAKRDDLIARGVLSA